MGSFLTKYLFYASSMMNVCILTPMLYYILSYIDTRIVFQRFQAKSFAWVKALACLPIFTTDLNEQTESSTLGLRGIQACGGDVRPAVDTTAISNEAGMPVRETGNPLAFSREEMSQLPK